jgi:MarR family transcriptional regulator, lower aerobic nicotinate degradation pathway regulator
MGSQSMSSHASRPNDLGTILDSIRDLVRALRRTSQAAERDLGISGAQLFVLQTLGASAGPMSVNDLAEATLTHQSSVSVVVRKLVERGLVQRRRARDDARRLELEPTAAGHALLRQAPPTAQQRLVEATRRLPPGTRTVLAEGLAALVAEMRPAGELAPMFFEEEENKQ